MGSWSGDGTILFNMAVHPINGKIYVSNTESPNEVQFEGPGGGGSTVQGRLSLARISVRLAVHGDAVHRFGGGTSDQQGRGCDRRNRG